MLFTSCNLCVADEQCTWVNIRLRKIHRRAQLSKLPSQPINLNKPVAIQQQRKMFYGIPVMLLALMQSITCVCNGGGKRGPGKCIWRHNGVATVHGVGTHTPLAAGGPNVGCKNHYNVFAWKIRLTTSLMQKAECRSSVGSSLVSAQGQRTSSAAQSLIVRRLTMASIWCVLSLMSCEQFVGLEIPCTANLAILGRLWFLMRLQQL